MLALFRHFGCALECELNKRAEVRHVDLGLDMLQQREFSKLHLVMKLSIPYPADGLENVAQQLRPSMREFRLLGAHEVGGAVLNKSSVRNAILAKRIDERECSK